MEATLKIAVSGKGGVGKSTLSAFSAKWFASRGMNVLAVDADPDANFGHALGVPDPSGIVPLSEMKELVGERTESTPGGFGGYFKLNPRVDDLPETLAVRVDDRIRLLVMGGVKKGGTGCVCPENILIKNLVQHLVLRRDEVVVIDMEAGIEHLGRGTAAAVDCLVVVVEPGRRSIDTGLNIERLALDIGLTRIAFVGNKIRRKADIDFVTKQLEGRAVLGFIPFDDAIIEADMKGIFADAMGEATRIALDDIAGKLAAFRSNPA